MFFQCPIHLSDQGHFTFTWNSIQYTFTHLLQYYHHSHTLTHSLLALAETSSTPDLFWHHYTNDILMGRPTHESVAQDIALLVSALGSFYSSLQMPRSCPECMSLFLCRYQKYSEIILQSVLSLPTPSPNTISRDFRHFINYSTPMSLVLVS